LGISIRRFADLDGCNESYVRKAIKRGQLPQLADGTIDPALAGSGWRRGNQQAAAEANPDQSAPPSLAEAQRRKETALAKLRELQLARESSEVCSVAETAAMVAAEYAIVRNALLALPARIAPTLVHMRTPELMRAALSREIEQALEALSADASLDARRSGKG
jgi:hypothetical protein